MPIQPTLDTEIETLRQAIDAESEHITREQYIYDVQPMKVALAQLIEDNEIIKAANAALIAAEPPTAEEVEKTRKRDIANGIAEKYTLADENSMMRKLHTGESLLGDTDIQDWLNWVATKKSEHPKV